LDRFVRSLAGSVSAPEVAADYGASPLPASLDMEKLYYLAFSQLFEFIGPLRFRRLLDRFGSAEAAWSNLRLQELLALGIKEERAAKCLNKYKILDLKRLNRLLSSQDIKIICNFEEGFPANLRPLPDSPFLLYVRGQLVATDTKAVAIVGTRRISSYGQRVIETIVPGLVNAGVTIVSGLAFGVDAKVAEETLAAGGRALAVLASGVDQITPRNNELLGQRIIESGGAIVSELPPGVTPQNYFFPIRNRIISGLALGVVVVEAAEKSGSLHTVNFATDQGRQVMAVPGSVFSEVSRGTNRLIRDGAAMVTTAEYVLEELGLRSVGAYRNTPLPPTGELSAIERKIFDLLSRDQLPIDTIIRTLKLPPSEVSTNLTLLQLKGLIKDWGGGVFGV